MSSAAPAIADATKSPPPKGGRKKIFLLAVPVLLASIGAGLWFGGILPPLFGKGAPHAEGGARADSHGKIGELKPEAEARAKVPIFVDIPDLIANLNVGQRRSSFIKLKARIELGRAEDQPIAAAAMPRLQDLFTTYLREMRPEELRGAAGTYRLREELIARANIALAPGRVVDVLFSEMLIQ